MAYGSRYRGYRRRRRMFSRSRARRGNGRRYSRAPRRRVYRRRRTRRSVLNVSTRKLKDTMPPVVITEGGFAGTPGVPYRMTGQLEYTFAFCPSARDSHRTTATDFPVGQRGMYQRSLTDVYARGYKEIVSLASNSGANWLWRRLVVSLKNPIWKLFPSLTVQREIPLDSDRASGQVRTMYNIGPTPEGETELAQDVYRIIFEGTLDLDWHNVFNAKPDKRFVRVRSDRTMRLRTTNDEAYLNNYQFWDGVNANMHYNEKESGSDIKMDPDLESNENTLSKFSAEGLSGAGDLWVFDFFSCGSKDAADELRFQPNGTFFWHER